jgi:hypothetical protein
MQRDDAVRLLTQAVDQVIRSDRILLELDVTERALSCRIAHYMHDRELVPPPLSIDCEYNRHFAEAKRLQLPPRRALDREVRATTVFPDIIVHERNSDESNLLAIEMKKPGGSLAYDRQKLLAFRRELGYLHTAHLILGLDASGDLVNQVIWVDDA